MRLTLLTASLLLCLHTCFAAVPKLASSPADSMTKPPVVLTKKKGTIGFISGLVLGPVGLGGVYLFSHNHAQRKAAKKGCVIFATVVAATALCVLIVVLAAKSGSSPGLGSSSRSGGGSGSGRSGGSGGSTGGTRNSGGGHSSNNNWGNNFNWPGGPSATPPKKKPAPNQLPADLPFAMFPIY